LNWSWNEIRHPLSAAISQPPLPLSTHKTSTYYNNFKPFILEEARAVINEGLQKTEEFLLSSTTKKQQPQMLI